MELEQKRFTNPPSRKTHRTENKKINIDHNNISLNLNLPPNLNFNRNIKSNVDNGSSNRINRINPLVPSPPTNSSIRAIQQEEKYQQSSISMPNSNNPSLNSFSVNLQNSTFPSPKKKQLPSSLSTISTTTLIPDTTLNHPDNNSTVRQQPRINSNILNKNIIDEISNMDPPSVQDISINDNKRGNQNKNKDKDKDKNKNRDDKDNRRQNDSTIDDDDSNDSNSNNTKGTIVHTLNLSDLKFPEQVKIKNKIYPRTSIFQDDDNIHNKDNRNKNKKNYNYDHHGVNDANVQNNSLLSKLSLLRNKNKKDEDRNQDKNQDRNDKNDKKSSLIYELMKKNLSQIGIEMMNKLVEKQSIQITMDGFEDNSDSDGNGEDDIENIGNINIENLNSNKIGDEDQIKNDLKDLLTSLI